MGSVPVHLAGLLNLSRGVLGLLSSGCILWYGITFPQPARVLVGELGVPIGGCLHDRVSSARVFFHWQISRPLVAWPHGAWLETRALGLGASCVGSDARLLYAR